MGENLEFVPPFRPGRSRTQKREQVAAVCFRILSTGVEFLLIRTRRGRWTFPKGGVEAGLSHAQSAALEAYEEAGVHGRIEELAFTRYLLRKSNSDDAGENAVRVHAHLCEVLQLAVPQEAGRDPSWFSSGKAKRRLAEGRSQENAAEFARVVDRALSRIRRLPARAMVENDPLFTVRFEASEIDLPRLSRQAASVSSTRQACENKAEVMPKNFRGKVLQLMVPAQKRPSP